MSSKQFFGGHTFGCPLLAVCVSMAVAGFASPGNANAEEPSGPVVQTAEGPVRGVAEGSMDEFLGIPYAAPPVGKLRFAPPEPPPQHSVVLDATKYGASCPQAVSAFSDTRHTSENCLYINIYTPGTSSQHPVMVWIHGGGFMLGSGAQYNPTPLVRKGVVAVNFNYRLGILGFLADPALSATSKSHASGNYGLMDQQAALRWVRANIAKFGGDPNNVTLFGQSAGGTSVLAQLVMRGSAGLFNKAIIQSAGGLGEQQTLAQAEAGGATIVKKLDCAGSNAEVVKCLRGLPVSYIAALETSGSTKIGVRLHVDLRPDELPKEGILYAFKTGGFYHVPIMEGTTRNEGRFFVGIELARDAIGPITSQRYPSQIQAILNRPVHPVPVAVAQRIAREYPLDRYGNGGYALSTVYTDWRACTTLSVLRNEAKSVPTFAYEFADKNPPPILPLDPRPLPVPQGFHLGSSHLSENMFLFSLPAWSGARRSDYLSPNQQKLSEDMIDYWTNFAKTSNPGSPPSGPAWPRFVTDSQRYMQFLTPAPQVITVADFAREHKCSFWAKQKW